MELGQLETFLAIARERSFSRAAERLYRTQPAISLALKRLEQEVGETLVDRTTKGGTLTDAGETLLPMAQRMLDLREEIRATFGALRGLSQGRLSIGANESMSIYLLPQVLLDFQRQHPGIHLQAFRMTSERIPLELLDRRIDVGFLSYEPHHPELESELIYEDHMVLVAAADHPLARRRKPVDIQELGRETFVAHNVPTPTRMAIIDLFAQHATPLRMAMELGTIPTILDFVAMGAGLAILPKLTVLEAVRAGRIKEVPLRQLRLEKPIRMVHRREGALSPAARSFLALLRARDFNRATGSRRPR